MVGTRSALMAIIVLAVFSVMTNHNSYPFYSKLDDREINRTLPSETLNKLTAGYNNPLASFLWIELLNYFGGRDADARDYHYINHQLKTITTMNPKAEHAYYLAAVTIPWETQTTVASNTLLQKAMLNFPDSWHWPYYYGFNAYWFDHDFSTAADYLAKAASKPDAPSIITQLALRMQSQSGQLQTALIFLDNQINETEDKELREVLLQQRITILTEKILQDIESILNKLTITSIKQLHQMGYHIPKTLPDGGHIILSKTGEMISSHAKKRFRIFVPPHKQTKHKKDKL